MIGVLLFLIHHDQAQVLQGGEHGAAGAHHDIRAALLDHLPLEQPLGVVEGGMLHRHPAAEGHFQPSDHLGGQADLGHQNKSSAAQPQGLFDQLEEHQGLAAARDPVQQGRVGLAVP